MATSPPSAAEAAPEGGGARVAEASRALAASQEAGDKRSEAKALISLAEAHLSVSDGLGEGGGARSGAVRAALDAAAGAKALFGSLEDQAGLAGAWLLLACAQTKGRAPQAALNSAASALELYSKLGDKEGQAKAWQGILRSRLSLGQYEDALKAGEAALVLAIGLGDQRCKAETLLGIAKAHAVYGEAEKALKAGGMALDLFRGEGAARSARFEHGALELVVQALLRLERVEEAAKQAAAGVASLERCGERKLAALAALGQVRALTARGDAPQAIGIAEKAARTLHELRESGAEASLLAELASLRASLGHLPEARAAAEEALALFREAGDAAGEAQATDMLGAVEDASGALSRRGETEQETARVLEALRDALERRNGPDFQAALKACESNQSLSTSAVEEYLHPTLAKDPIGAREFWIENQPECFAGDHLDYQGTQFDRMGLYHYFRLTMMGYGPGFRLLQNAWRKGPANGEKAGLGTVDLKDDREDWEEGAKFHPGMLDCALQIGIVRIAPKKHSTEE